MENRQIAQNFEDIANLLAFENANRFRIIAYQRAAETVRGLATELTETYQQHPEELEQLPNIGTDLRNKIIEMLETGNCDFLVKLLVKYGYGILEIMNIRGIGPKKARLFFDSLGIDNVEKLRNAALNGQLQTLPRMGAQSEKEILVALQEKQVNSKRMLLNEAYELAENLINYLKQLSQISKIEYAGSLRRGKETVGDIDILLSTSQDLHQAEILPFFQKYPGFQHLLASGTTRGSAILKNGIQVDLRIIPENTFGAALHYFTGSKAHNVALRNLAKKQNYKISEYGIFKLENDQEIRIGGEHEDEVFQAFNLPFISPRLREDNGEIAAAQERRLPNLIAETDLRGDLHTHSTQSDGQLRIVEVAQTMQLKGHLYYAQTDHSWSFEQTNGMISNSHLKAYFEEIARAEKISGLKIFKGVECDILADGTLDLANETLEQFDFVIASIHDTVLPAHDQTERLLKAISHPRVHMIGHLTARLLNERNGLILDLEKIFLAAVQQQVIIEINSNPKRLDPPDSALKFGQTFGVKFAINTDFHRPGQEINTRYGIWQAQRGWLEKKAVINTLSVAEISKFLRK